MDWKSVVSAVAPTLATALGGPLAGAAALIAGKVLLGNDQAKPQDIISAVTNATPEALVKLKEIEASLVAQEKELGFKYENLEVRDRISAREREEKQGIWGLVGTHALAAIVLGMTLGTVYFVFKGEYPSTNEGVMLVGTVVGYVFGAATQVLSYYFGSSSGSRQKSDAMAEALSVYVSRKSADDTAKRS